MMRQPDPLTTIYEGTDCFDLLSVPGYKGIFDLAICDPPYGNIVKDKQWKDIELYDRLTVLLSHIMKDGSSMYVWGGIGKYLDRPFFTWLSKLESVSDLRIHNVITWSKKRAYGKATDYLFTREECAMLVKNADRPKTFNIPLLDVKRGYEGYNKKYPAKSEYKRRTNVWTDITEIFRGKIHQCQKPQQLHNVMISTSSNAGDLVIDPFAGCGGVALECSKLGRRSISVELMSGGKMLI